MSNRFIQKRFNSSPEGDVDLNDVGEVNKVYRICALFTSVPGQVLFSGDCGCQKHFVSSRQPSRQR